LKHYSWGHATFSPDGQFVAAGSCGGELFVWETADGRLKKVLTYGGQVSDRVSRLYYVQMFVSVA
jgi:WD40 repeat protein